MLFEEFDNRCFREDKKRCQTIFFVIFFLYNLDDFYPTVIEVDLLQGFFNV